MNEVDKVKKLDMEWFNCFRGFFCEDTYFLLSEIKNFIGEGYKETLAFHEDQVGEGEELEEIKKSIMYFVEEFRKINLEKLDKELYEMEDEINE